ncbi:Endosulfine-domain-containing protein [Polychaeton citri CBS 116435]|uniref:mRNA stability protein n=1 Tax=Polychaeton citri CBS 116435 TaxID=1314669 RepID=A0A9P4Q9E8_9PEZI|nr:Endosulfine-domain-containing protein [Polychaeton citri CBS 116435]
MNPHQKNKVDINSLSEEEQKLFRLYGKLPNKKDLLQNKLKERKYFDSGDYAMSKAGKSDAGLVGGLGREHPSPDSIPHLSPQNSNNGGPGPAAGGQGLTPTQSQGPSSSPVKEPSVLQRGMSVDEQNEDIRSEIEQATAQAGDSSTLEAEHQGVPIRQ